jgi:hypothetical protein
VVLLLAALGAAVLVAGAGAVGENNQATLKLTSKAAIDRYLVSMGYNPRTFVVQRGARNYAGARCPGATWNCTTARRVIQISRLSSANEFTCVPRGSGGSAGGSTTCVIVQVSQGGLNDARCIERDVDRPFATQSQSCKITQENTSGRNVARATQKLRMFGFATVVGSQDVEITQSSLGGNNSAIVRQTLEQVSSFDAQSTVSQSQSGDQDVTVDQNATGGANSSDVQQLQTQTATATQTTGAVSQLQNAADEGPDTLAEVDQTSSSGRNSSLLDQSIRQEATGNSANGPVTQTQGSATGGLLGTVNQSSSQPSTSRAVQREDQILNAVTPAGTLTQTQFGPSICCATQVGNDDSTASISQTSFQSAGPDATQTTLVQAHCQTPGSCTATQTVTNNDGTTTDTETCTGAEGESCEIATQIACSGEACESGPIPGSEETFVLEVPTADTVFTFDVTTASSLVDLLLDTRDCCIAGDSWGARLIAAGSGAVLAEACGDGNIETFSGLATATGFTGYRAEVFYCEGVDVFPAGLDARFRSENGAMDATPTGSCVSPTKTCEGVIG